MNFMSIHPDFKWQGQKLNQNELLSLAEEYSHSGQDYLKEIGRFFKDWFNEEDLIEVQTSGSTGAPKKMKVKKAYMCNSAEATQDFFNLPAKTTALLCMPVTYIAGKLMLVRALHLGWEMDMVAPQANPLSATEKDYDFTAITPYQLEKSLAEIHRVKKIMVGGGKVSDDLLKKIQHLPSQVYETYAMTETLTHIAARAINDSTHCKQLPPFQVLKGVSISRDERGCLVIKAPKVTDEIIYTNDLVELESGQTFRLKGRIDNVINSGGIKLHPEEIESKLSRFISHRFFVYGESDDVLGQRLVLIIENEYNSQALNQLQKEIQSSKSLSKYERPKKIYFISQFINTHSGKIKREATFKKLKL